MATPAALARELRREHAKAQGSAADPHIQTCAGWGTHWLMVAILELQEPRPRLVLDIPSGQGAMTRKLKHRGFSVHAADLVPNLRVTGVEFTKADMDSELPFEHNSFDAVACSEGIEHLERPFDFLRECGRVLRPNGVLVLSTPNISSLRSRWRWLLTGFHAKCKIPLQEGAPPPHGHIGLLAFHELRYMLHTCGFVIDRVLTNRIKPISWFYAPLVPASYLVTQGVMWRETRTSAQRQLNRQVLAQMFSLPVLFGEALILGARRRTEKKH